MNQKKESALREYLKAGEQICWHGVTEEFPLLGKDAKSRILAKWIGAAIFVVAGVMFCFAKYAQEPSSLLRTLIGVAVVAVILVLTPLLEQRKLMKQEYWITNQRVLMMDASHSFYSIQLSDVDAFYEWKGHSEKDCLVVGSELLEDAEKQLRWRACHPKTPQSADTEGSVEGLIFYSVSDLQGAVDQLCQQGVKAAV